MPPARAGQGSKAPARKYWLMKTEPDMFSIDKLESMGRSCWDGVRSFQARNHMLAMQVGDLVLFYHSSTNPPGVVGLARVVREAYPDHTQFDPKSPYYDARSKPAEPRWSMVDVEFVEKLPRPVTLEELKADPALTDMLVVRRGQRLSVQPVDASHMRHVLRRAQSKHPV
jgi:predicted RNA-binding protein with PUA-like domain